MRALQFLGVMDRRQGVDGVGGQDQSLILPVVEVCGTIAADTTEHPCRSQQGIGFVFTIPVVGAIDVRYLEAMRLDGFPFCVKPYGTGTDGMVGDRRHRDLLYTDIFGGFTCLYHLDRSLQLHIVHAEDIHHTTSVECQHAVLGIDLHILHGKARHILYTTDTLTGHRCIAEEHILHWQFRLTDVVD